MPHPAFLGPISSALLALAESLMHANAPTEVVTQLTRMSWQVADMGS